MVTIQSVKSLQSHAEWTQPLEDLIGKEYGSIRAIRRHLRRIQMKTDHARIRYAPLEVDVVFGHGEVRTIMC